MPSIARILLVLAVAASVDAADIYVTASGNDGTGTGTVAKPYRQIRKGLSVAQAGDTVHVADGSYLGFDVASMNGTSASPITIKADGTNAVVTVTTDRSDNRDTIFITYSSWIVVDGLRSFNANRAAVRIDNSPHITIRNGVYGNNTVWGIFTDFSDDLLIENNECYGSVQQHGIYVGNSGDRPIVRGNRIHDNGGCGLHMNGDISQGGDGIISGALIEKNISYSNGAPYGGSCINCDGVQDSVFRDNLIYDAHASGISLYQTDGGGPSSGNLVVANTIDMASDGRWSLNLGAAPNTIVYDNVLVNRNAAHGSIHISDATVLPSLSSDYNVLMSGTHAVTPDDDTTYLSLAQWQALGHDAHSLASTQSALFVNPGSFDYHLLAGSPAIDSGVTGLVSTSAPTTDLDGNARPQGAGYDLGAYEVVVGGGTTSGSTTSGSTTSGSTTSGSTTSGATTSGSTTSGGTTSGGFTAGAGGGSGGGGGHCGLGSLAGVLLALTLRRRR
jgi:parallel beta-helix repeat protein